MLGFDALGRLALGELPLPRPATGPVYAVLAAAAAATFTPTAQTQANTVLTTAGAGAITIEVVGQASATLAVSGASSFGAADELMSVASASFAGTSVFTAVSYAFYADADTERACLHQEIVTALVSPEDKIAIVPFEDRVYRTPSEARGAGNQPRKRIC